MLVYHASKEYITLSHIKSRFQELLNIVIVDRLISVCTIHNKDPAGSGLALQEGAAVLLGNRNWNYSTLGFPWSCLEWGIL